MTVLFHLIPCLREKAPTEKQGADHTLFFHAYRDNLVQLQEGLSLAGSFANAPSWPNMLQPRRQVPCTRGGHRAQAHKHRH